MIPDDRDTSGVEQITWAALASNLAVWLPYFFYVTWLFVRGTYTPAAGLAALLGAIVLASLLSVAIYVGIVRRLPKQPADERDAAVAARATRNAYYVVLGLLALFVFSPVWWGQLVPSGLTHQLLLGCYVVAETVRLASRGWYYRGGW